LRPGRWYDLRGVGPGLPGLPGEAPESGESRPVNHPEDRGWTVGGNTLVVSIGGEAVAMIDVAAIPEITSDPETREAG